MAYFKAMYPLLRRGTKDAAQPFPDRTAAAPGLSVAAQSADDACVGITEPQSLSLPVTPRHYVSGSLR